METFNNAYSIIGMNSLPSKTKETAFQILNSTTWTNNKAFKSGKRDNPNCDYCGQPETIEHLLHNCEEYSAEVWTELGHSLTAALNTHSGNEIPKKSFRKIIFSYLAKIIDYEQAAGQIFLQKEKR